MNPALLRRILEEHFDVVPARSTGDEVYLVCPQPGCTDESGHRSVNLKSGLTGCWICNRGGHVTRWLRELGVEIDADDLQQLRSDLPPLEQILAPKKHSPEAKPVKLPGGFIPLSLDHQQLPDGRHTVYWRTIAEMAERKNLSIEDFVEAGAGYTRDDPKWEPYCIFPVFSLKQLVCFQGRLYAEAEGVPTKRFPSRQELPFGPKYYLYNFDAVYDLKPKVIVVVEAILNVLSLQKRLRQLGVSDVVPVSAFHSAISSIQWNTLLRQAKHGVEEICLLFDADATAKAWHEVETVSRRRLVTIKLSVAEMPPVAGPKSDPNDDVDAALDAFDQRKVYMRGSGQDLLRQVCSALGP